MPTPTYTFTAGQQIRASEFNTNFALLQQCLDLNGGTLTGTLNLRDVLPSTTATYVLGSVTKAFLAVVANALKLTDSNSSHLLSIVTSSNLTANRTLTLVPGDADRTVTIEADCTIGGVAPVSLGGTGLSATPTNGQIPIGNGTGFSLAELTAGSNISITNGAGTITINASGAVNPIPCGAIFPYAGATAPSADWQLCDGTAISRATYATLFGIIGTTYGVGDGSTTFNVPDFRQRFPMGKAASGTGSSLGSTGGNIDHTHSVPTSDPGGAHSHGVGTLTIAGESAHTHTLTGSTALGGSHTHDVTVPTGTDYAGDTGSTPGQAGTFTTTDSSPSEHTHGVGTLAVGAGSSHTHTLSGSTENQAAHIHAFSSATGSANPPFLSIQFIIKLT